MTTASATAYIDSLETAARAAATAEESFHREVVQRFADLERQRQYAYRRFNLIRSVARAIADAKDEEEASARGAAAFMHELEWSGATELQRAVTERFGSVVLALWRLDRDDEDEAVGATEVEKELAAFEQWFVDTREGDFLSLLDRDLPEIPLVEF